MEPPKKLITRIVEACALLALSAFLLRLAVAYLLEIWVYLLIIVVIAALGVIGWRIYKFYRSQGKW
ncbi:hypothetical protein D5272_16410 [bacterium D16-76]|uniref:tetratricopeptide repeat protein n=1 Tax=Anaerotruncus colihominis TaxID=169435 RepID=UPI0013683C00|nr:hypothetical protein [bacterium D16-76]